MTLGDAPGLQANLVILHKAAAFDFLLFALRNPRPCPILAVTEPGDPCPHNVAPGANLCTDLPKYRVWRYGELAEEVHDVSHLWGDDMVGFLSVHHYVRLALPCLALPADRPSVRKQQQSPADASAVARGGRGYEREESAPLHAAP